MEGFSRLCHRVVEAIVIILHDWRPVFSYFRIALECHGRITRQEPIARGLLATIYDALFRRGVWLDAVLLSSSVAQTRLPIVGTAHLLRVRKAQRNLIVFLCRSLLLTRCRQCLLLRILKELVVMGR